VLDEEMGEGGENAYTIYVDPRRMVRSKKGGTRLLRRIQECRGTSSTREGRTVHRRKAIDRKKQKKEERTSQKAGAWKSTVSNKKTALEGKWALWGPYEKR